MIWVRDGQLENTSFSLVSSCNWIFPKDMDLSCLQEVKSSLIFVTFEVSKLERSRVVKEEQPENIQFIFVTLEVSKLERSRDGKDMHPQNI